MTPCFSKMWQINVSVFLFPIHVLFACQHKCQKKKSTFLLHGKKGKVNLKPISNEIKIEFNEMKKCYKKIVFFPPSWAMFAKTCESSLIIKTSPIEWSCSWTSPSLTIGHVMRGSMGFCILKWVNVWLSSYLTYKTKYLNNICWRYWINENGIKLWYYEDIA